MIVYGSSGLTAAVRAAIAVGESAPADVPVVAEVLR